MESELSWALWLASWVAWITINVRPATDIGGDIDPCSQQAIFGRVETFLQDGISCILGSAMVHCLHFARCDLPTLPVGFVKGIQLIGTIGILKGEILGGHGPTNEACREGFEAQTATARPVPWGQTSLCSVLLSVRPPLAPPEIDEKACGMGSID